MVLPDGADPVDFRWPALDALVVDGRALSRPDAIRFGAVLVSDGCRYVALLGPGDEPLSFWRQGARSG